jgi:hypothetical protein
LKTVLARFIFICIATACSLLGSQASFAQGTGGDSSATTRRTQVDSVMKPHLYQPNPKKAGLYSAIVPGLGQAYNHEYWKIPVIYVGLGVAGYFIADNLNNYQTYRKAYIGRINNPYPTDQYVNIYTTDQLSQLQNDYNKYLDLTVLFTGVGYMLQIIDAVTSAHLKNFDISRDISMQVSPMPVPHGAGLGMVVNFR